MTRLCWIYIVKREALKFSKFSCRSLNNCQIRSDQGKWFQHRRRNWTLLKLYSDSNHLLSDFDAQVCGSWGQCVRACDLNYSIDAGDQDEHYKTRKNRYEGRLDGIDDLQGYLPVNKGKHVCIRILGQPFEKMLTLWKPWWHEQFVWALLERKSLLQTEQRRSAKMGMYWVTICSLSRQLEAIQCTHRHQDHE